MPDTSTAETQTTPPAGATDTSTTDQGGTSQTVETSASEENFLEGTGIDPKAVPEQSKALLRQFQSAYTKKTQGIAEDRKFAQAFRQLTSNPEFIQWWNGRQNKETQTSSVPDKKGAEGEASFPVPAAEEWESIREDPQKFARWQQQAFEKFAEARYGPQMNRDRQEFQQLKSDYETQTFAQENPDFWDIDALIQEKETDPGLMEVMAAAGLDLSTAYHFGKRLLNAIELKAAEKAKSLMVSKQAATSETASSPPGGTPSNMRVKGDLSEAIAHAAREALAGRQTVVGLER